jgi:methionyl-tRNA formyltransferase
MLDDTEIKLFGARAVSGSPSQTPGTVLRATPCLEIAAGVGAVEVQEVQPAGKKRMSAGAWARGRKVSVGQRFA